MVSELIIFIDMLQGVSMDFHPINYTCNNNNKNKGSTPTQPFNDGHQLTNVGSSFSNIAMPLVNLSFYVKVNN